MEIVPNDKGVEISYDAQDSADTSNLQSRIKGLDARLELTGLSEGGKQPRVYVEKVFDDVIFLTPLGCEFRSIQMRDRPEAVDFKNHYACLFEREGISYCFVNCDFPSNLSRRDILDGYSELFQELKVHKSLSA